MTYQTTAPPKCPACGRLTVDNAQHCADYKPGRWFKACRIFRCKCGHLYDIDGHVGKAAL